MGQMKSELLSTLESDSNLHNQYWLDQMINHHYEPVFPYSNPLLEFNHAKDLSIHQPEQSHYSS